MVKEQKLNERTINSEQFSLDALTIPYACVFQYHNSMYFPF